MKIAVLGTGPSVDLFDPIDYDLWIGVNDIWKFVATDVIVCLDNKKRFTPERMAVINRSTPHAFYSQIVEWDTRDDFKKISITPGYPDQVVDLSLPSYAKSYCSPFVAVQIAFKVYGAKEIHLYGVDLVNHPHLNGELCKKIKVHFRNLKRALVEQGCQMVVYGNGILSPQL
jgi:hypothetical protein